MMLNSSGSALRRLDNASGNTPSMLVASHWHSNSNAAAIVRRKWIMLCTEIQTLKVTAGDKVLMAALCCVSWLDEEDV